MCKAKTNYNSSNYFVDQSSAVIFYLLELAGEQRATKLNITRMHYNSTKTALNWYNDIISILDMSSNINKDKAIQELTKIYNNMCK